MWRGNTLSLINVFASEQSQSVTVMVPYCPVCFNNMQVLHAGVAPPPPGYEGLQSPEQMYMDIATMRFGCPDHPEQTDSLNYEQIELINKYPISRQFFKNTMRYNRKDRRKGKYR